MKCPKCSNQMKIRKGIHGEFWGCTDYPNCKGTVSIKKEGREYKEPSYKKVGSSEKVPFMKVIVAELSNFDTEPEANEYMKKIRGIRKGDFKINHYEKPDEFWQVEWHSDDW